VRRSCALPEWAVHAETCMPSRVADIYPFQDNHGMKPISFLGNSLECLRECPEDARQDAG